MKEISFYKQIFNTTENDTLDFDDFVAKIKAGYWQDVVIDVRAGRKEKIKAPLVTVSGRFKERNAANLVKHSGLIAIDFDDLGDETMAKTRNALELDPYTHFLFTSIGGRGLCCVVKIDGRKHLEAFEALSEYYLKNYNALVDISCKDVSRCRFISYDPDAYYNETSIKFTEYLPEKPTEIARLPFVPNTSEDVDYVMRQIVDANVNICNSYADWRNIGFALADEMGAGGEEYFRVISQISGQYRPDSQAAKAKQVERQWRACLKAGKTGISIKTFFYYAKAAGLQIQTPKTVQIVTSAYIGKKRGSTAKAVVEQLEKMNNITAAESEGLVRQVYENDVRIDQSPRDIAVAYVKDNYNIRFNLVTEQLEDGETVVDERRKNTMYLNFLAVNDKATFDFFNRVLNSESVPAFNPLAEWLGTIPAAAGAIDSLAATIISPTHSTKYITAFIKRWLVGVVGGVYGSPSPLAIVFTGAINTGKTWFFRNLLPEKVGRYFAETEFNQKKDDLILLTKNLIVFVDEWRSINEKDPDFMKYIITAKHFDVRKAYRADDKKYTRVASLCGTSNHDDVIVDTHHNRRIIPIHVERIDWERYNSIDKNAVFAEALALYRGGYGVDIDVDEMGLLRGSQDQFEVAKREKELLFKYFMAGDENGEIITTTEILVHLEKMTGVKNLSVNALGKELKAAGWERKRTMSKTWGWHVTYKDVPSVNNKTK